MHTLLLLNAALLGLQLLLLAPRM
jgi:hypothetical protein